MALRQLIRMRGHVETHVELLLLEEEVRACHAQVHKVDLGVDMEMEATDSCACLFCAIGNFCQQHQIVRNVLQTKTN